MFPTKNEPEGNEYDFPAHDDSQSVVLGDVKVQISTIHPINGYPDSRILQEGNELTVYCDAAGKLWLRFPDEFNDGRFEELTDGTEEWVKRLE